MAEVGTIGDLPPAYRFAIKFGTFVTIKNTLCARISSELGQKHKNPGIFAALLRVLET